MSLDNKSSHDTPPTLFNFYATSLVLGQVYYHCTCTRTGLSVLMPIYSLSKCGCRDLHTLEENCHGTLEPAQPGTVLLTVILSQSIQRYACKGETHLFKVHNVCRRTNGHVHVVYCGIRFLRWVFSLRCSCAVCGGCIPETTISRLTLGYIKLV